MKRTDELETSGWLLCTGFAALLQACGGANAATTPTTPDNPDTAATDDSSAPDPALAQVLLRCAAVQANPSLPVSCKIDDSDDGARMVLIMKDRTAAQRFIVSALDQVAQPFCDLANQRGAAAQVVVGLNDERLMKLADCSNQQFGDWSSADPEVNEMEQATRACSALQASSAPVACGMSVVDDTPALVVAYDQGALDQGAWNAIAQGIASPFCDATRARGIQSAVFLIEDAKRARGYNCATNQETGWVPIQRTVVPRGTGRTTGKSQGIASKRVTWRTIAVKE